MITIPKAVPKIEKQELIDLYINQKLSMNQISKIKGVSATTVYNLCKRYQIATRSQLETFNFKGKKHSSDVIEIISKTHKGKKLSQETKKKISEGHKKGGVMFKKKHGDGYIKIYFPDHPRSTKEGYIMEHILVMECLLGRHLNENEVVHHINEKKDDNRKENLKLMTRSEHMSYHSKKRQGELKNAQ